MTNQPKTVDVEKLVADAARDTERATGVSLGEMARAFTGLNASPVNQPKTVKVRIPVAVDGEGNYVSNRYAQPENNQWDYHMDWSPDDLKPGYACHWIEAELPIPEITTVQATLTKEPSE